MTLMEKAAHAAERKAFEKVLDNFIKKGRTEDAAAAAQDLVDMAEKIQGSVWKKESFEVLHMIAGQPEGKWAHYVQRILDETDPYILKTFLTNAVYEGGFRGYQQAQKNAEKYGCNIPWLILMDPTSACNMHCTGCWAAEYGHQQSLTFEEMDRVLTEAKELGTHACLFTGGEPLIRKKDIIRLCEKHRDMAFHAFTNGTLIDDDFCKEMLRVGNFFVSVSIEGFVLQNLLMNALILILAARLAGVRAGKLRIGLASALGCGYAVCAYLPWGRLLLGLLPRTAACAGMTLLLCGGRLGREWRRTVRAFAFIWISTALLGGTGAGLMYLLGARGYGPLAALGTAALGGGALIALTAARNRKMSSRTALLTVQRAGRRVSLVAIVDTGNSLVEPLSNLPVIVVEKDALSGVAGGRMRAVPFTSVGGGGVLSAFAPDSVRVDGREVEAFVAVYDGVLNTEGRALIPGRCMG